MGVWNFPSAPGWLMCKTYTVNCVSRQQLNHMAWTKGGTSYPPHYSKRIRAAVSSSGREPETVERQWNKWWKIKWRAHALSTAMAPDPPIARMVLVGDAGGTTQIWYPASYPAPQLLEGKNTTNNNLHGLEKKSFDLNKNQESTENKTPKRKIEKKKNEEKKTQREKNKNKQKLGARKLHVRTPKTLGNIGTLSCSWGVWQLPKGRPLGVLLI